MFQDTRNINTGSILTFTFWYAVVIYIFAISFCFWLWRTDIKPEKN